jgi:hypothetical protein
MNTPTSNMPSDIIIQAHAAIEALKNYFSAPTDASRVAAIAALKNMTVKE